MLFSRVITARRARELADKTSYLCHDADKNLLTDLLKHIKYAAKAGRYNYLHFLSEDCVQTFDWIWISSQMQLLGFVIHLEGLTLEVRW